MKLTCKFTGIPFSATYFGGLELRSLTEVAHPIFSIPKKQLWSRVSDFHQGANLEERKLLFIAVAASTNLVSFRVSANPSDSIVQSTFNRLVSIASWIDSVQHPAAVFPRYVIDSANKGLENISKGWLEPLEELRAEWQKAELSPRLYGEAKLAAIKAKRRADALDKIIQRNMGAIANHGGMLASWIIGTCAIPDDEMVFSDRHKDEIPMQQFVTEIIACKDEDILSINTDDVGYLAEFLLDRFPQEVLGTRQAHAAVEQCKRIIAKHEATISTLTEDYEIVSEDDELIAMEELPPEPSASAFSKKLDYLMAKAAWNVKKAAHDRVAAKAETTQVIGESVTNEEISKYGI